MFRTIPITAKTIIMITTTDTIPPSRRLPSGCGRHQIAAWAALCTMARPRKICEIDDESHQDSALEKLAAN
jgi:hypothetical protein